MMLLITPPLPAASRPSNTTTTLAPVAFTHSCISTSVVWSSRSAFSYSFLLSFLLFCSPVPFPLLLFAIDRNLLDHAVNRVGTACALTTCLPMHSPRLAHEGRNNQQRYWHIQIGAGPDVGSPEMNSSLVFHRYLLLGLSIQGSNPSL